jgi:hypothetical protein
MFKISNYLSRGRQEAALDKYERLETTKKGQKTILSRARKGETEALDFVFLRSDRILGNLFSNNYILDKKGDMEGAWESFVSMAYEVLASTSFYEKNPDSYKAHEAGKDIISKGPLASFNPEIYEKDPTVNLISKFGWYYQQIMKSNIAAERRRAKKDPSTTSIDKTNAAGKKRDFASSENTERHAERSSNLETWKRFAKDPKLSEGKYPLSLILKEGLLAEEEFSKKFLERKLGISTNNLVLKFNQLQSLLVKYDLSYEDVRDLILDYGYSELKSYL